MNIKNFVQKIKELINTQFKITKDSLTENCPYKLEPIFWRETKTTFFNSNPGRVLRGARYKESLSQKQLGKLIGVSRSTISRMENCKKEIDREMAKRLGKALNISCKVFLEK